MSVISTDAPGLRFLPASVEGSLRGSSGRLAGAVLLLGVLFGWASLLSWSGTDPSLTRATGGDVANWAGIAGAIVSDLMLQTFGLAAVALLFVPTFWGLSLIRGGAISKIALRSTAFALAIVCLSGAMASLPIDVPWQPNGSAGGLLGAGLFDAVSTLIGLSSPQLSAVIVGMALMLPGILGLAWSADLRLRRKASGSDVPEDVVIAPVAVTGLAGWLPGARRPAEPQAPEFDALVASQSAFDRQDADTADRHASADDHHDPLPAFLRRDSGGSDLKGGAVVAKPQPLVGRAAQNDLTAMPRVVQPVRPVGSVPWGETSDTAGRVPVPKRGVTPVRSLGAMLNRAGRGGRSTEHPIMRHLTPGRPGDIPATGTLEDHRARGELLQDVLADFGVRGEIRDIKSGPVVTVFELEPERGTKSSRVIGLADDIARSMSARSARIAVVPGKNVIGIELPNAQRDTVTLREILEQPAFRDSQAALPIALGQSITGEPVITDLARMPHVLIAGTTGSGKSVGINAMIVSLLLRHSPENCRFLMIDPKMLELSVYNDIPHLLTPVVTDPHDAVAALKWAVGEMEERYKRMAKLSVRNVEAFNARVRRSKGAAFTRTVQTGFDPQSGQPIFERERIDAEPMPYIVVVVDEFADLMAVAGKDIEATVQRLVQMARAAGIHLIMATQRPSIDVITGTIKANFPTRVSFKVVSKVDSRTILNVQGAEQLLGNGDMLFAHGGGAATRVHGPFVSDEDVERVTGFLRACGAPRYVDGVTDAPEPETGQGAGPGAPWSSDDELFERALAVIRQDGRASASYFQRRLAIGYNKAANLIERMEREGIVSVPDAAGRRQIIADQPAIAAPVSA